VKEWQSPRLDERRHPVRRDAGHQHRIGNEHSLGWVIRLGRRSRPEAEGPLCADPDFGSRLAPSGYGLAHGLSRR